MTPATDASETSQTLPKPPSRDHTPRAAAGAAAELNMSTGEEEELSSRNATKKATKSRSSRRRPRKYSGDVRAFARGRRRAAPRAGGHAAPTPRIRPSRPWTAPALVTHYAYDRRRSAAFRRARSAFVAAAAAAARAMAAAGTRFGGGEDGEARRARRKDAPPTPICAPTRCGARWRRRERTDEVERRGRASSRFYKVRKVYVHALESEKPFRGSNETPPRAPSRAAPPRPPCCSAPGCTESRPRSGPARDPRTGAPRTWTRS